MPGLDDGYHSVPASGWRAGLDPPRPRTLKPLRESTGCGAPGATGFAAATMCANAHARPRTRYTTARCLPGPGWARRP